MLPFTALPRNTIFICGGWIFFAVQVRVSWCVGNVQWLLLLQVVTA